MSTQKPIKIVGKPAPIRNALLAISLTCNAFLFTLGYAVATGNLVRVEPAPQQLVMPEIDPLLVEPVKLSRK